MTLDDGLAMTASLLLTFSFGLLDLQKQKRKDNKMTRKQNRYNDR